MTSQVEMELIQSNRSKGFAVGLVGELVLVTPFGAKLTDWQRQLVHVAAELQEAQHPELAGRVLARLQRCLGVTQDLHQQALVAASTPIAARAKAARDAARKAAEAAKADLAAAAADVDPEPNAAVAQLLEAEEKARAEVRTARVQAERAAAAAGRRDRQADGALNAALEKLRLIEDRLRKARARQLDTAWSGQALAETRTLARARGEEVEVIEDRGAVRTRIRSRDGLRSLFESGSLNEIQLDWGLAYRAAFEAAHASQVLGGLAMLVRGRAASSDSAIAAARQRAKLMADLAEVERLVVVGKRGPFRLRVLREVAGEGRCLGELATGGDARRRLRGLLIEALSCVPDGLAAAKRRLANQAS